MAARTARADRPGTRQAILDTAERLFALRGVHAVSNRQISEAAGQGNSAAVGYHFGAKTDLVRAIVREHADRIEAIRAGLVADAADSDDLRTWIDCLVSPFTAHLAELGSPTWYARFHIQVTADPALREIAQEESLTSPSLRLLVAQLTCRLPGPPEPVRNERLIMARNLIITMAAEHERALTDAVPTAYPTWNALATGLTDAIIGLWRSPSTS